jgi:hypothetical protein
MVEFLLNKNAGSTCSHNTIFLTKNSAFLRELTALFTGLAVKSPFAYIGKITVEDLAV